MLTDASIKLSRRSALVAGGLGTFGLSLSGLLANESKATAKPNKAKSVLMIVPWGGPASHDTFDLKPDAPEEIRSEFQPIATRVPGLRICEHLPQLAERADRFSVIRSMSHEITAHNPATYYTLTGHIPANLQEFARPQRTDWPSIGSVLAKEYPSPAGVPGFVMQPCSLVEKGFTAGGQHAGFLGTRYDPFIVSADPSKKDFAVADLNLSQDLTPQRIAERRGLLEQLEAKRATSDGYREQAYDLLSGAAGSRAFDVSRESDGVRDRYGRNRFGQSVLLGRRLIEAGVRLVMVSDADVKTNERWDTHEGTHERIERNLKETDTALSTLLDDLQERGLLESTLVVWMGEFGRSPKVDPDGGRDHWSKCYCAMLAGGGIPGGVVVGSSDKIGAYPRDNPCTPADVHATIYHHLGLPLRAELTDASGRPGRRCEGTPIKSLC